MKALHYGDNLQVLRDAIATESVDLIYLDPPFNSNATRNVRSRGQSRHLAKWALTSAYSQERPVRPEGAEHQWRKVPPRELSVDLVADEREIRSPVR